MLQQYNIFINFNQTHLHTDKPNIVTNKQYISTLFELNNYKVKKKQNMRLIDSPIKTQLNYFFWRHNPQYAEAAIQYSTRTPKYICLYIFFQIDFFPNAKLLNQNHHKFPSKLNLKRPTNFFW
eukprot:TRINITY_DN117_c0_g1_i1.p1 TRINITY_DN117_c0_g1~~TRINITY_DN117_c0_g1_i1.p1  ORF type:complete len:123 (+),score=0.48 TRINITY_DN117_c0_g1_i1:127-495(+)